MATRYARDPMWMDAKYPGHCSRCKAPFAQGARIFYYPAIKSAYCKAEACGVTVARDFEAAAWDEEQWR